MDSSAKQPAKPTKALVHGFNGWAPPTAEEEDKNHGRNVVDALKDKVRISRENKSASEAANAEAASAEASLKEPQLLKVVFEAVS